MDTFVLAIGILCVGLLTPGPSKLAIVSLAVSRGRRAAMRFATGVACGSVVWCAAATTGLVSVLLSMRVLFDVLQLVGACLLIYYAYDAFCHAHTVAGGQPKSLSIEVNGNLFLRGLAIHLTNPKAAFAWFAFGTMVVQPDTSAWLPAAMTGLTACLSLAAHYSYACFFSMGAMTELHKRWAPWIFSVFGCLYLLAAASTIIWMV